MSRVSEDITNSLGAGFVPLDRWAPGSSSLARESKSNSHKIVRMGTLESPTIALIRRWLYPTTVVIALLLSLLANGIAFTQEYVALCFLTLFLSGQIFRPLEVQHCPLNRRQPQLTRLRPLLEYAGTIALLMSLAAALKMTEVFSRIAILSWFFATPVALLLANFVGARLILWLRSSASTAPRHIIIGVNEVGLELAKRMEQAPGLGKFLGFFDHRSPDRLPQRTREQLVGHCRDVAMYVRRHSIDSVYIALPISTAPRIAELLEELRDTTASVYFVPNLFAFDLLQARYVDINGMPALAVCETPLRGMSGVRKRLADIAIAILALTVLWPLLLAIALAVRLTSPGPILFKQKRYGLNGEEILVYKFRSMTVCENGSVVVQATKSDRRITPLGKMLRRTSLDELPQILNVLEGKMSFVGPRPHAIAHNEQYRKLISGYMIRHKVKPGITGWAQINGLRGETETVEKMRIRVAYDLEYLQKWSLWLDVKIIFKTAFMIFRDKHAY